MATERALIVTAEAIAEKLRARINDGRLVVGETLPTLRAFADELQCAKGTVLRAYEILEAEGFVENRGFAGRTVRNRPSAEALDKLTAHFRDIRRAALDDGYDAATIARAWASASKKEDQ